MRGRIARLCPAGRCVFVLLVFTLLAAGRADAQWNGFIHINGGEQNVDRIVTNTLQVEIYDETATYEAAMTSPGGLVFDASVGVRVVGNLGVGIGGTVLNARGMIALDGSVPSPLIRGRHRTASREQPGLKHQQIGVHIPVVYVVPVSERVQVASAGPSWFRLRHERWPPSPSGRGRPVQYGVAHRLTTTARRLQHRPRSGRTPSGASRAAAPGDAATH